MSDHTLMLWNRPARVVEISVFNSSDTHVSALGLFLLCLYQVGDQICAFRFASL